MVKTKQKTESVTALAPQSTEKSIEFQAFGSHERVQLSINIVRKWLVAPTKSGKTASDSDVMKFIMLCKARQLNPWEGDAFLIGYDSQAGPSFSLITAHQAFLKRAEAHGQFDGMKSGVILANADGVLTDYEGDFIPNGQTLAGGWCKVYRKDHAHPKVSRLNLSAFDKGFGQWKANPAGMIVKCAEADALRGTFPNTLGGMYNDAEAALVTSGATPILAPDKVEFISDDQRAALVEIAKEVGVVEQLGNIVKAAGFEMLAQIPVDRYADMEIAIRSSSTAPTGQTVDGEIVEDHVDPSIHNRPENADTDSDTPDEMSDLDRKRADCQTLLNDLPKNVREQIYKPGSKLIRDMDEAEVDVLITACANAVI